MFNNSPRLNFFGFQSELAFVLLTYASALYNTAANEVESLGFYEKERYLAEAERESKDKRLTLAISLLATSSGVFTYVTDTVLIALNKEPGGDKSNPRVADLSRPVIQALSKYVPVPVAYHPKIDT